MTEKLSKYISISFSVIAFIFLVKFFYIDTKLGFQTQILELTYSSFPMFIDVFIGVLFIPFLVYGIMEEILYNLIDAIQYKINNV